MALTQYYVDPAIAGNSGTGTIGDPFGDLQYALNTVTRDATNGDQFNIKAGTDEILTATLSLATYGTTTDEAQLLFRGYTSVANDGGIGGISGAGSFTISTDNYIKFVDMHLHNCGSATIVTGIWASLTNCELDTTTGHGVQLNQSALENCYLHNIGSSGVLCGSNQMISVHNCFFKNGVNKFTTAVSMSLCDYVSLLNNVISVDSSSNGISINRVDMAIVASNSIYSNAGTGTGIGITYSGGQASRVASIKNNIIEGFSGVGGTGASLDANAVLSLYGYNKFFNNATQQSLNGNILTNLGNNSALSASPFTNPANDDFTIRSLLTLAAYPSSFYGSNTNQYLSVGASQPKHGVLTRGLFKGMF